MKKISVAMVLLLACWGMVSMRKPVAPPDEFCGIRNYTFSSGEQISYTVFYNLAGVFVNAGAVSFTTTLQQLNGRPVYHVVGDGRTHNSYDWIYKVRDRYETFIDTATMQPLKFIRNVNEGGDKIFETIAFNKATNTAVTNKGSFKVPACVQDVLSAIYYARNIDYARYKKGDKIPFSMFLDGELHNLYVRYQGTEEIKTRYGTFNSIKFSPLLIKGTIFEGGEKMTVWVSNDANRVPVRIESPIIVGSVKVDMMGYKGLRYPMGALKKLRKD
ncbi:DUF3108 domain-containing protein [Paracnuella aquatica]|uniref:DUF3108 domain-containing protein n=1 Tax=Paracnuella aquatica TaxID=2268757 RepID=UPI001F4EDFA6|nr:DUF3108 domain-containing protein [Paracnuella aquatica]